MYLLNATIRDVRITSLRAFTAYSVSTQVVLRDSLQHLYEVGEVSKSPATGKVIQ